MFVFGCWAGIFFCTKKVHVKMIWKQFLYNFMVLPNGPVKNALFCLMDRYRNVCVWFMARNCRFPKVGTHCTVANVGTTGYYCKELPVPRDWNWWFPTWEPQVTIARNCRLPEVGTHCCQRGNQRLPLQGTAGSQRLELLVPNLGTKGHHAKELPVPRPWNLRFPTWEPEVTIARNCRFPEVRIYVFEAKPEKVPLPVEGSVDCKKLELMVLNVVLFCLLSR